MEKVKVTQDFLYAYLTEHNLNLVTLAKFMGVTHPMVYSCFRHNKDAKGNPRNFTDEGRQKLNDALPVLAKEIKDSILTFGSEQTFTNRRHRTYDRGQIPAFQRLSKYFGMKAMTGRVLGWTFAKMQAVLYIPSAKIYGYISAEDVAKMNVELLAVAGFLNGIEVSPP